MVNNGLQESVIHLSLIEPAEQEYDRLAQGLSDTIGTSVLGKEVHEPVAWQKLTQAHHV
jgi:hypothetical protein